MPYYPVRIQRLNLRRLSIRPVRLCCFVVIHRRVLTGWDRKPHLMWLYARPFACTMSCLDGTGGTSVQARNTDLSCPSLDL